MGAGGSSGAEGCWVELELAAQMVAFGPLWEILFRQLQSKRDCKKS